MEEEVKLLGFWASPFSQRVIWALKLKGINYDYIEEDVFNKSQLLLTYNPVHKKIPVLVHRGKPIAESQVILEYIEETWPQNPLLPKDAFERASARFWMQSALEKEPTFVQFFTSTFDGGENGNKAARELAEVLKVLEEHGLKNNKFFGGETLNMVDLVHGLLPLWLEIIQELVGVKLIEPKTLPRLYDWVQNFKQIPIIKENLPDRERLFFHMKTVRERAIAGLGES